MNQQVKDMVNSIMQEQFEVPVEKLVPSALLKEDLQLDSLDFVDMVVVFEEKVGGSMPAIDFLAIKKLEDIYALVDQLYESKKEK